MLSVRAITAYVKSWDEAAVANLNPSVREVYVAGFDPILAMPIWYVFRSSLRDKIVAWFKLAINVPFFAILIHFTIIACKTYLDHEPEVHHSTILSSELARLDARRQ